jgi:hypothetical protein
VIKLDDRPQVEKHNQHQQQESETNRDEIVEPGETNRDEIVELGTLEQAKKNARHSARITSL